MDELEPLDPTFVQETLSRPPFVNIPGVINVRDLGNLPSLSHQGSVTKRGYLYRSAELSGITEEGMSSNSNIGLFQYLSFSLGKARINQLGITKVFDLRSDTEIAKYNSLSPVIDNVVFLHIPIFKTEDYSPEMMAR